MAFDGDDELLMNLGYKPELRRNFTPLQVFGIAFSIMSLVPSIASVFSLALEGGGVGMTWGWLAPSILIMSVGVALAELGSAMPTSGGLYWWTYKFAPENYRKVLCWLAGYANCLGLIAGLCSIDYGFGTMVLAIPNIAASNFTSTRFQGYGVFVGAIVSQAAVAMITTKFMSRLQTFCIAVNAVLIGIICIALPIGLIKNGGQINSAKYVFGDTTNLYEGWPYGWAWFLSWMACIWTIGAFDSCIHMSEEASNAATAVPMGIVMAIGCCGLLGWVIMCVLAAVVSPDTAAVLASSTGSPFAQVVLDCLGKKWAIAIQVMMSVVQWLMGLSIFVAASRQTWSFSRDGALPFSRLINKLDAKRGVPYNAIIFDGTVAIVIGLLILVGGTAANALFSIYTCSNSLAWLSPIIWRAWYGQTATFKPGPFYLGERLSRINNVIASLYLIFSAFVIGMWPSETPVSADTMNYTCLINPAIWIGCLIYYWIDGHKWFNGPQLTIEVEVLESKNGPIDKALVHMPSKMDDDRPGASGSARPESSSETNNMEKKNIAPVESLAIDSD